MYCKDCKWWKHIRASGKVFTICNRITLVERRECDVKDENCAIVYHVLDDSGLDCDLVVGPMFGCVKFVENICY